jgi:hypothetical protein
MLIKIEKLSLLEYKVNNDEIELFNTCFKNIIGKERNQLRKLETLIYRDNLNENTQNMKALTFLKTKMSNLTERNCLKIIEISENFLKGITGNSIKFKRIKLYFQKTIADHWRYLFELSTNLEYKTKANEAYTEALNTAEKEKFLSTDMIYLTFYLNYTVFLHDILENTEEAVKRAKAILHAALKDTEEITEINQKDVILLCQMIKDNLSLWKNEIPEELKFI